MEKQMTLAEIEKLINSNNKIDCWLAFKACAGRNDIPLEWLEKGVKDNHSVVRRRAFKACEGRSDVPSEWLEKGINDEDWCVRESAFCACIGRSDVPLGWLEKGVTDSAWYLRSIAFQACADRNDIPLEWLEKGVNDKEWVVRCCAFEACAGRSDVPLEWLERGVTDRVSDVRTTASKVLFGMGYQFPLVRMVEPADKIYKQCRNGVIVVAEIPKTAQVRGRIGGKCRASEATIVEIIPNEGGCIDAVSMWDGKITYKVSDHIIIDNFDHSNAECSTGFHFFNTIEEARNYSFR